MTPFWFRPWMAWAVLVVILAAMLGVQTLRLAEAKAEHADALRKIADATTAALETARKTETGLRADLDNIQARAAKEKESAKSREDALVDAVRTGERRLSIAALCPSGSGIRAPATGGSGPGVSRADIDPAAADRIVAITRDGDNAIRERNACVAAYEAVRQRLDGSAD